MGRFALPMHAVRWRLFLLPVSATERLRFARFLAIREHGHRRVAVRFAVTGA